jgi:hypothetical protein
MYANELADQLAIAAACNTGTAVSFSSIPKSTLYSEIEEEAAIQNGKKSGKTVRRQP